MRMNTRARFPLPLLFLCVASVMQGKAEAQETKPALPPHFSDLVTAKFHQQSLKQIVTAIDKQSGLNMMIDGEPIVALADIECNGTLAEALNKIADTFDYTWKVSKGGIVLFNKRFHNRDEVPQASVPELTHFIQNIRDIFSLFTLDPAPDLWPNQFNKLSKSFTEKQRAAFLTGRRLRASELSPEQLGYMREAVFNYTFGSPTKLWSDLAFHLSTLDTAHIVATAIPEDPAHPGARQFSYDLFWQNRDGSFTSENILLRYFGN